MAIKDLESNVSNSEDENGEAAGPSAAQKREKCKGGKLYCFFNLISRRTLIWDIYVNHALNLKQFFPPPLSFSFILNSNTNQLKLS